MNYQKQAASEATTQDDVEAAVNTDKPDGIGSQATNDEEATSSGNPWTTAKNDPDAESPEIESKQSLNSREFLEEYTQQIDERLTRFEAILGKREDENLRLQEKVQSLRQDQISVLLSPGMRRITKLMQELEDAAAKSYGDLPLEDVVSKQQQDFEYFAEVVEDIILAFGFERLSVEQGGKFERRFHQAVGREATANQDLDKRLAREIYPGFIYTGSSKANLPATVTVYEYDAELCDHTNESSSNGA